MARYTLLALLIGVVVAHAADPEPQAAAQAVSRDADRVMIEALEHEWLAHESDRATLERMLAPDFVHVVPQGLFLTREQHIDWAVRHPRPPGRRAKFEELHVRVYGNSAIATGIVADTDFAGRDVRRSIFTDVFVRRKNSWQAINAQEDPVVGG
jgi:hypothetical protein